MGLLQGLINVYFAYNHITQTYYFTGKCANFTIRHGAETVSVIAFGLSHTPGQCRTAPLMALLEKGCIEVGRSADAPPTMQGIPPLLAIGCERRKTGMEGHQI